MEELVDLFLHIQQNHLLQPQNIMDLKTILGMLDEEGIDPIALFKIYLQRWILSSFPHIDKQLLDSRVECLLNILVKKTIFDVDALMLSHYLHPPQIAHLISTGKTGRLSYDKILKQKKEDFYFIIKKRFSEAEEDIQRFIKLFKSDPLWVLYILSHYIDSGSGIQRFEQYPSISLPLMPYVFRAMLLQRPIPQDHIRQFFEKFCDKKGNQDYKEVSRIIINDVIAKEGIIFTTQDVQNIQEYLLRPIEWIAFGNANPRFKRPRKKKKYELLLAFC